MRGRDLPPKQMVYETTGPLGSPRWWLYWESNPGSRCEGPASSPLDDRALRQSDSIGLWQPHQESNLASWVQSPLCARRLRLWRRRLESNQPRWASVDGIAAHRLTTRPRRLGSPGWNRTSNLLVNSQAFYQLNYGRMEAPVRIELTPPGPEPGALPLSYGAMEERAGFEPANPFGGYTA